jgi:Ca2+/H+ antiporter, TMEM165/GDT1 family
VIPFWHSFFLIFVAEMGDKTQLVALAFATRFGPLLVLGGILLATLVVHLASVAIGEVLGLALPEFWLALAAGLAFIFFGLWTLRGDRLEEGETNRLRRFGPFLTVTVTFFLAELGDKSMLATVTLAAQYQSFVPVWLGSTLGMVAADGLAIGVGTVLGRRLPATAIKYGAAAIFIITGLVTIGLAFLA